MFLLFFFYRRANAVRPYDAGGDGTPPLQWRSRKLLSSCHSEGRGISHDEPLGEKARRIFALLRMTGERNIRVDMESAPTGIPQTATAEPIIRRNQ
ncbi:hypothetical protein [Acetivibrio sp. MSJd-27]|uniref:hypothetical protein n=1 Tax=Acetivibrio sp. MSJd-27 TaxID=2841523 RepID=UPI001C0F5B74|nr:hypothetical protein [Acetivibrio sp. MSJd-27]MBU5449831.1 hypothetical protein [Acetivibrio sp. MSJd-27]